MIENGRFVIDAEGFRRPRDVVALTSPFTPVGKKFVPPDLPPGRIIEVDHGDEADTVEAAATTVPAPVVEDPETQSQSLVDAEETLTTPSNRLVWIVVVVALGGAVVVGVVAVIRRLRECPSSSALARGYWTEAKGRRRRTTPRSA